jgi:multimeric flavodoxin WrbA
MSLKNKIVAVGASPRKYGNSDIIMDHFCKGALSQKCEVASFHLRDLDYSSCVGCEACRKSGICTRFTDDMGKVYTEIIESKGLFLISPVYNYNITSFMKAFIDRLYCFYIFEEPRPGKWSTQFAGQNRKAVVATVCEQSDKKDMGFALEAMRMPVEALGYNVLSEECSLNCFYKGKITEQPDFLDKIKETGSFLAKSIMEQ